VGNQLADREIAIANFSGGGGVFIFCRKMNKNLIFRQVE
jgi:hypothetical protein